VGALMIVCIVHLLTTDDTWSMLVGALMYVLYIYSPVTTDDTWSMLVGALIYVSYIYSPQMISSMLVGALMNVLYIYSPVGALMNVLYIYSPQMISSMLVGALMNVSYDPSTTRQLSQELATRIMEKVKEVQVRRYKYVVVVSIGSLNERHGMQVCSRCLWDHENDSFITVNIKSTSLFAVAILYGIYRE